MLYEVITPGTTSPFWGTGFIAEGVGWAVGPSGLIFRSNDFGHSWTGQTSGTITGLMGVAFSDYSLGIAVGRWATIMRTVITSYSIHYTKLYEQSRSAISKSTSRPSERKPR